MTETQERYVLQNCPLVVDPAAASLEVKASLQRAGVAPTADLQRVQVRHDTFGFGLDSSMVHFFGPAARADDCPFLLAYDATGRLRHRIDKEGAEFVASRLPEETNGRPVAKPSVRLTFDDLDRRRGLRPRPDRSGERRRIHPRGQEMTGMTVGVLLYGDHPVLAKRCLDPLWPLHRDGAIRLRIGCNECGPATLDYLQRNGAYDDQAIGLVVSAKNIHKYPMMRQLIALAPLTPNFMWFDDDSYVDATGPVQLIGTVADKLGRYDMVGQVWGHHLGGRQHLWVKDQPWYGGKPVAPDHRVRFCQGAWWAIRSAISLP